MFSFIINLDYVLTSEMFVNPFSTNFRLMYRHRPASLIKMSLFHRCFSNILVVKTNYLIYLQTFRDYVISQ